MIQHRISQAIRIAGRINTIRSSDKMFELVLDSGQTIRGVAPSDLQLQELADLFGKTVVVVVVVVCKVAFRPSGSILRLEASKIEPSQGNVDLWLKLPTAQRHEVQLHDMHVPQTTNTGLNKIWGQWPGDETDEQIRQALGQ